MDGSVLWVKSSNVPRATQASANQLFNDRCTNATASGTMRQVSGEPRTMWQQEALRRYIKDHRDTPAFADSTVFLSDPRRERELDERLLRGLWPGVRDAVEPGLWTLLVGAEAGMSARDGLTTPRHADISRALTFLIEDPDRPRMPGAAPPWFCRGTLSCASDRFFVAFDFTLSLPIDFPFPEILRLLSEPRLAGCPPELRFDPGVSDASAPTLELGLTWGRGAGPWDDRAAFEAARDATAKNVRAINAVHHLERDFADAGAYDRVCERLMDAYESF